MLKLKYYSLSKEEKNNIKNEFYNTEYGKNIKNRLNRLLITGIFGIIFSLYLFISNTNIWEIIIGVILIITSIVFVIASFKVRINKINDYLVKLNK